MSIIKFVGAGALASAIALAACSTEPEADADGDGTITQDEVESVLANSDLTLSPGQWENTVEFVDIEFDDSQLPPEARGMVGPMLDAMRGQKTTTDRCISEDEAKEPAAEMFSGSDAADCEYSKFEFGGGSIDMAMVCKDPQSGTATITNTGSYDETSYSMEMKISMDGSEMGPMKINAKAAGKRVGDCPE
ncbi:DUF3617 domain-containing protein [Erythrobacter sp. SCSIO 43205]|uniref:DUF3617 domain-containing protein n=1 Tax=Erythrobacter sp. SCSIO 43205 TaxID=2779361 RepID=UPI001CA8F43A|nr:DUF3617 domain-containing protein [Erythrobacter sp. SCSIO 43205]UAB77609.1 DUF3617 domain-containing protein [Erythrobacter sp. SCSIO 43205]